MKKVISSEKVPIKMWLPWMEDGAEQQAKNVANLPGIFKHVAIMPDCHQGYGMPIGGVAAFKDIVIPNAVGVDIGCGMSAMRTNLKRHQLPPSVLKEIMGSIRKAVPVGFKRHDKPADECDMPVFYDHHNISGIIDEQWDAALKQLGTLGGGNHFIEIQVGTDDHVWIMVHSGSRNLGNRVAHHWNNVARELGETWHTSVPKSWQLDYLPLYSDEGQAYIKEMEYCTDFAYNNRCIIMQRVGECIQMHLSIPVVFGTLLNIAHNYAAIEHHFGKNVVVHRKGATRAYEDELGIIPGSQGTSSYIVRGKGNPESFKSCSHGAGRNMSRSKAKEKLNLEDEIAKLEDLGVVHGMRNVSDLDEAPGAYKDIEEVMGNQLDLVDVEVVLKPICVVKG
jgi:tRNA-splicing ligase RtcB